MNNQPSNSPTPGHEIDHHIWPLAIVVSAGLVCIFCFGLDKLNLIIVSLSGFLAFIGTSWNQIQHANTKKIIALILGIAMIIACYLISKRKEEKREKALTRCQLYQRYYEMFREKYSALNRPGDLDIPIAFQPPVNIEKDPVFGNLKKQEEESIKNYVSHNCPVFKLPDGADCAEVSECLIENYHLRHLKDNFPIYVKQSVWCQQITALANRAIASDGDITEATFENLGVTEDTDATDVTTETPFQNPDPQFFRIIQNPQLFLPGTRRIKIVALDATQSKKVLQIKYIRL